MRERERGGKLRKEERKGEGRMEKKGERSYFIVERRYHFQRAF